MNDQDPKQDLAATFLAPPEITAAPKRRPRPNIALRAIITLGVIVVVPSAVIGANELTASFIHGARIIAPSRLHTESPKPHASQETIPAFDLTGFRAAISGTDEQSFMAALNALSQDDESLDTVSAVSDAPRLIAAASVWLADLRATNPPPAYQGTKASLIKGAKMARRAGHVTLRALQRKSLTLLAKAASLAERVKELVSGASPVIPQGS
jgi:hypothetical protein